MNKENLMSWAVQTAPSLDEKKWRHAEDIVNGTHHGCRQIWTTKEAQALLDRRQELADLVLEKR